MHRQFITIAILLFTTFALTSCGCTGPNASGDLCAESTAAAMIPFMIAATPVAGAVGLINKATDPGSAIVVSNKTILIDELTADQLQTVITSKADSQQSQGGGYLWTDVSFDGLVVHPMIQHHKETADCVLVSNTNSSGHFLCELGLYATHGKTVLQVMDASSLKTITSLDEGICEQGIIMRMTLTDNDRAALSCVVNGGLGGNPAILQMASGWQRIGEDTQDVRAIPHSNLIVVTTTRLLDFPDHSLTSSIVHPSHADENAGAIIVDSISGQRINTFEKTPNLASGREGKLVILFGHETAHIFKVEGTTFYPLFDLQTGKHHPFTAFAINDESNAIIAENDQTTSGFSFIDTKK